MAGTAVVATGCGGQSPVDVPGLARSVRALVETGWDAVLVPSLVPSGSDVAGPLTLALGQSRSGRRAVPVVTHLLVDPADPALAYPEAGAFPEPLAVLEAEAIAALVESGFTVVVAGETPVVPNGSAPSFGGVPQSARGAGGVPQSEYRPVGVALDEAASARRLAGDLGAPVLVFVAGDDSPLLADGPGVGELDVIEAERRLTGDPRYAAELRAAVRFLRAGGELAVITTPALLPVALDDSAPPPSASLNGGGTRVLRVRRKLVRPRSEAPALAAGWC